MFGFDTICDPRRSVVAALLTAILLPGSGRAQDSHATGGSSPGDLYRAVMAAHFRVDPAEIRVLESWGLPTEELPVVLFMARRTGVVPDALIALRRRGWSWPRIAGHVGMEPEAFELPPGSGAADTAIGRDALPDASVVHRVNLWMLVEAADLSAEEVLRARGRGGSFPAALARLREPGS